MRTDSISMSAEMCHALARGRKTGTRRKLPSMLDAMEPGDELWVREQHWVDVDGNVFDYSTAHKLSLPTFVHSVSANFMERWASRFLLTITEKRHERLGDLSREDAIAEGLTPITKDGGTTIKWGIPDLDGLPGTDNLGWAWQDWDQDPVMAFQHLWRKIYGRNAWRADLEVLVLRFTVEAITPAR